jgi:hypothetical protein
LTQYALSEEVRELQRVAKLTKTTQHMKTCQYQIFIRSDQIKEGGMGEACSMNARYEKRAQNVGQPNGKRPLEV